MVMVMVDNEGDSIELVLGEEDNAGAYVRARDDDVLVADAGTAGQDDVKGCGQVTVPGLKLATEDEGAENIDNDAEEVVAVVMILGEAGAIVAPHVHTDTHVQIDEHVHENVDACVHDAAVASESDGIAPGGNGVTRERVDDRDDDKINDCCEDDVRGGNEDELDTGDMLSIGDEYVERDVEVNTSDDVEDDTEDDFDDPGTD